MRSTTNTYTHTVAGVFRTQAEANRAISELLEHGLTHEQISLLAPNAAEAKSGRSADAPNLGPIESTGSGTGPGTGVAVGSFAGFIAGMVAIAIPGLGPLLAAGPLTAGIMGAGMGAAAGAITGALTRHGVPEQEAEKYSNALGRGRSIITVTVREDLVDDVADILDRNGAFNVDEPDEHVHTSSTGSERPLKAPTPASFEAARLKDGEGVRDAQRARERRSSVFPGISGSGSPTEIV
ncbi:MAG TPA: DUF1269 domain-containing protein [Bryobacteraceae bacterium]|nr:DUF1269 domain-containing protein [Bryobacteraceae bacterium]